ncbi:MAG TPA: MBL fold metallo-hydrolase [Candidatus Aminicenantes bacterium]|nr:MBL fold metallo-hydrolase [Candidatus Aminicenantes bacterium]
MGKLVLAVLFVALGLAGVSSASAGQEKDVLATSQGDLEIAFLGHASLILAFGGKTIHVDPYGDVADYGALPKADLVLVTHEHFDHLDPKAFGAILKPGTAVVGSKACAGKLPAGAVLLANGESRTVLGLPIEAVPAYNIAHKRPDGQPFHPKGAGNGYVVTFGDKRVYIAGDTENTPEMKSLEGIDVAFLPMNLPYTMTPEQVADAARAFRPKILYPYHFGDTDTGRLVKLLAGEKGIEVRVRKLN